MPPRMCWKGGRGHRPDLGVSITFPGPESVPATLHPLLAKRHQNKTSCWNEAAVVQKQLNTTQPGPQGSHSVHRPLNPALGPTVPLVWFCFCRKLCVIPGALLQLSDVFLKVLLQQSSLPWFEPKITLWAQICNCITQEIPTEWNRCV